MMDLSAFRSELGDVAVQDHPRLVQQKSRDHYWYSPILKAQLDHVSADLVVTPKTQAEVARTLRAAFRHKVPVTPRGAGTGNYGQAMPLSGGAGGVGSIRWGGLRNFGNILGLKVITCEAEPRELEFTGTDILKVAHAYGTNGIIVEAEMPLTAAYDWVDFMAGFDSIIDACAFAEAVAQQDGLLLKEIAPVAAPVPYDYFNRHRPFIRHRDQSVVCMMVAPFAAEA